MDEYIAKKDVLSKIESAAMWNRSLDELYDEIRDMQPVSAATGPMTNGDRIRAMSNEELAIMFAMLRADLTLLDIAVRPYRGRDVNDNYDWLQQPAEADAK